MYKNQWFLSFILSTVFFPIDSFIPSCPVGLSRLNRNVRNTCLFPLSSTSRKMSRNGGDDEITSSQALSKQDFGWTKNSADLKNGREESIYDSVIDYDVTNKAIIYECSLGRSLGIEITQGDGKAVISEVTTGSKADLLGIQVGDSIVALQATAGDQLWEHVAEESVKAALATRFVVNSTVRLRLQRKIEAIPAELIASLLVPYTYNVRIRRPIGLHVLEGPNKKVYVEEIKEGQGASKTKTIEVGDEVVAMSASWGDRMWDVNSVESFIVGVRMRSDPVLSFKLKRVVTLASFIKTASNKFVRRDYAMSYRSRVLEVDPSEETKEQQSNEKPSPSPASFNDLISKCTNGSDVQMVWSMLQANKFYGTVVENYSVNRIMTTALSVERADIAVNIFEQVYGFEYSPNNPAKEAMAVEGRQSPVSRGGWATSSLASKPSPARSGPFIEPNNFVCTTAIKAYGRLGAGRKALALVPWFENKGAEKADIYTLSSLLYVCAKEKNIVEAEKIFWEDIPARKLKYTIATTNSLMYMYARLNRADDALRVYEVTKSLQIKCTVVTFGVLIKALLSSGKKQLESTSYEILSSLPAMGLQPGVDVYNQFLEHYAKTHDFRNTKKVLSLMGKAKPRVRPDALSYGFIITCYSEAKKPKNALSVYGQMKQQGIATNGYVYMGVLKSLATMRDGLSAVQVITEMRENGIQPDKRHISMAMFACVISDVNNLAESLLALYIRIGGAPDTALYTLLLRALLQQNKWGEGYALLKRMSNGNENSRPNFVTMNYLLRSQVVAKRYSEARATMSLILQALALKEHGSLFEPWQQPITGPGRSIDADHSILSQMSPSSVLYKGVSPQGVVEDSVEGLSHCMGLYSSHMNKIQKEDGLHQTLSYGGGLGGDNSETASTVDLREYGFSSEQTLGKPTVESLEFLVDCVTMIASQEGTLLPGYFYMELLQALSVEGSPELTSRVLDIGQTKSIRVQSPDMVKMSKVEDVARRSIQGRRLNQPFSANILVNEPYQQNNNNRGKMMT